MNQRLAKRLRKLAKMEMAGNANNVDRELVLARINNAHRVINEPISTRSMYLQLKGAYKESVQRGLVARVNHSEF